MEIVLFCRYVLKQFYQGKSSFIDAEEICCFFVLKIVKSKSLKQNQILLYHFHNFSTPRRFWMINYGQGGIQQLWQNRNQPVCQELLETRVPTSNGNIWIDCQSFMTQYWEAKHFLAGSRNSWKNNCCCYLEGVNL